MKLYCIGCYEETFGFVEPNKRVYHGTCRTCRKETQLVFRDPQPWHYCQPPKSAPMFTHYRCLGSRKKREQVYEAALSRQEVS